MTDPADHRVAVFSIPLVRELSAVLLLKLVVILGIKALWFSEPVDMSQAEAAITNKLGLPAAVEPAESTQPATEHNL